MSKRGRKKTARPRSHRKRRGGANVNEPRSSSRTRVQEVLIDDVLVDQIEIEELFLADENVIAPELDEEQVEDAIEEATPNEDRETPTPLRKRRSGVVPPSDPIRGPRQIRAKQRARARRRKALRNLFLAALLISGVVYGAQRLPTINFNRAKPGRAATAIKASFQETWLVFGTIEADPAPEADWISVFSFNSKAKTGYIIYIPRTTFVEIPGHGLDTLEKSLALGGEPLLVSAASNLLGVRFDHFLKLSDQATRALIERTGGITLTIDQKLTKQQSDGRVEVIFAEGKQALDGKRVSEYLKYTDISGNEIARAARHAVFWGAFFDVMRERAHSALGGLMGRSKDLVTSDSSAAELKDFFTRLGDLPKSALTFDTLAVSPTGVESGTQLYRADQESIDRMVAKNLPGSRPERNSISGRRVQILNGVGTPGIGAEASKLLIPKGFRIVLDQNAKHFGFVKTQIVVYSDSKRALAVAQEIRSILGVGETVVSKQQQSVVDVTIVIGKDFIR